MPRSRKRRGRPARRPQVSQQQLLEYCGQLGQDDGVDPAHADGPPRSQAFDRKTAQLCATVRRVIEQILSGESNDPVLSGCNVVEVLPNPNAGRLRVVVEPPTDANPIDVLNRLATASGWIRSEIAHSICRRKTPELGFALGGSTSRSIGPNEDGQAGDVS